LLLVQTVELFLMMLFHILHAFLQDVSPTLHHEVAYRPTQTEAGNNTYYNVQHCQLSIIN
jgi:hypothetical protein